MKSFIANVRYTAVPVPSDLIPSLPEHHEQILWVGCSDSQITETNVLNVPRQEFFVHRNLGNKLSNGDHNSLSAIEHCVQGIQVKHIIICGHYGCGLINARVDIDSVKNWFADLDDFQEASESVFGQDIGAEERDRQLVELNVLAQVHWIMQQPSVVKAIHERDMKVHGFVYDPFQGSCVRLEITSPANISNLVTNK